jgi:hypothetical protein
MARYKLLPAEDQAIVDKIIDSLLVKAMGKKQ